MHDLVQRLRERKLVQWALAYLAGAWVLLQVLDLVGSRFGWPDALLRGLIVMLACGFFAVLVLAWFHGEKGHQRVTGMEVLMLGGILLIAGAAVAWVGSGAAEGTAANVRRGAGFGATAAEQGSIAVLPFVNMSGEPENEYFSDGITEEILHTLARVPGLRVPGRTSSFYFKEKDLSTREIARQLGVAHVLEGSVRRAGDRVRIHVQLVDAHAERSVWSEGYDRQVEDVFALQGEIARAIADQLQLQLAQGLPSRSSTHVPDAEAYDLYLQGRSLWAKRGTENLRLAISLFEQAIAKDPQFAAAHAGRALVFAVLPGYLDNPEVDMYSSAVTNARQALTIDPTSIDARLALAHASFGLGRSSEAGLAYRHVLASDAANPTAHLWYSAYLNARGRPEEALTAVQRATQLDPFSQVAWWNLARALGALRRPAEAVVAGRQALALDTSSTPAKTHLAQAFLLAGVADSALFYMQRAAHSAPEDAWLQGHLAYVEAVTGRRDSAQRRLANLLQERRRRVFSEVALGVAYLGLGMRDSALVWLQRSVDRGDPGPRDGEIFIDPIFVDPLGADPRFHTLARRMGLVVYMPDEHSGSHP